MSCSRVVLHEFEPTSCLIELVVSHYFENENATKRQQTLYVLPTQRLCRLVAKEVWAKSSRTTVAIPHLLTWDQWKQEMAPFVLCMSNKPSMISLTLSEATPILNSVLRSDQTYKDVFHPDQAHELLYLWTLLIQSNRDDDWILCLEEKLKLRWTLPEESLQNLLSKWHQVKKVCSDFEAIMAKSNFVLSSRLQQHWMTSEASIAKTYLATVPFNRIVIAGLTNLTTIEVTWLKTMSHSILAEELASEDSHLLPRIEYHLPMAWRDLPRSSPLRTLASQIKSWTQHGSQNPNKDSQWTLKSPTIIDHLTILKCKDPWSESLTAVKIANMLHQTQGVPLHEIQIIVPSESTYANYLHLAIQWCHISSANVSLPSTWGLPKRLLALYGVIKFLKNPTLEQLNHLISSHVDEYRLKLHKLLQSISQPMNQFEAKFQGQTSKIFDFDFFSEPSFEGIYKRFYSASLGSTLDYLRTLPSVFKNEKLEKTQQQLQALWDAVAQFKKLTHQEAVSIISENYLTQTNSGETHSVDSDLDPVRKWLNRFVQIQKNLGHMKLSCDDFLDQFLDFLSTVQSRVVGEPMNGLQIIGLTEARFVPASVSILLGMNEGSFPASVPRDKILDDSMKSILGLPNWQDLESLEETTFGLLAARLKQLYLLYSEENSAGPQVPSRWVESFVYAGAKVHQADEMNFEAKVLPHALTLQNNLFYSNTMKPYAAAITHVPAISATDIKRLLACPFQFFAAKIGAQSLENWQDEDPRNLGIYLHKSIELAVSEWQTLVDKVIPESSWSSLLSKNLMAILPQSLTSAPEVLDYMGLGLPALSHWLANNIGQDTIIYSEEEFGRSAAVYLPTRFKDKPIPLVGTMDLVVRNKDAVHVLDFKLNDVPALADVVRLSEPQLLVYALALFSRSAGYSNQEEQSLVMVSYLSLTKGVFSKPLSGSRDQIHQALAALEEAQPDFESTSVLAKTIHQLLTALQTAFGEIEVTQEFKLNPEACDFCSFASFCRKEDPLIHARDAHL